MDTKELIYLLSKVKKDEIDINKAAELLSVLLYEDIEFAKIDHNREQRTGYPEVIYCEGKTNEQMVKIIDRISNHGDNVLGTRLPQEGYEYLKEVYPSIQYYKESKIMKIENKPIEPQGKGKIAIVTGGTSDIPIAEEAALTAEFFGNEVVRIYDVGVAGLHRLLDNKKLLQESRVIVAVAGMEGALPSVISGLVSVPVIGVPTSVGYGANFGGISALLSMLNSCAAGLSVVNIDNGFGAGYLASTINRL